jgi:hypothetical protein
LGMSRLTLVALAEFWAKAAGVALWGDGGARENMRRRSRELAPGAVPPTVTASEEMEVGRERKRHSHRHVDTHGGGGEGVGVRERGGGGSERVREAKDMHYFSLERDRLL